MSDRVHTLVLLVAVYCGMLAAVELLVVGLVPHPRVVAPIEAYKDVFFLVLHAVTSAWAFWVIGKETS